jgi:hypothetical protein
MTEKEEIQIFLEEHLDAIRHNNRDAYHASTSPDLTLYEWWVTPHRIDGLPFHDFMMDSNAQRGTVFGAEPAGRTEKGNIPTRFDLSNLKIQHYGHTAIASYTLLMSTASKDGVKVASHNESRVIVKIDGVWQVVHVHKSPAWPAPRTAG